MRADRPVAWSRAASAPRRRAKFLLFFFVLAFAAVCAHTHEQGAIDTPISFWDFWDKDCRIHRACKPVAPKPRCAPGLGASAARRAFTASKDSEDVRSVAGTLRSGGGSCTKVACYVEGKPNWQLCCNDCKGGVELVGEDGSVVGLTGEGCEGDESRLCCTIDIQGQKIIATGVLGGQEPSQLFFMGKYNVCAL